MLRGGRRPTRKAEAVAGVPPVLPKSGRGDWIRASGPLRPRQVVKDDRDAWSEHQQSAKDGTAFVKVQRCAVLSAESRAGQYKHLDIEEAAVRLHGLIDGKRHAAVTAAASR